MSNKPMMIVGSLLGVATIFGVGAALGAASAGETPEPEIVTKEIEAEPEIITETEEVEVEVEVEVPVTPGVCLEALGAADDLITSFQDLALVTADFMQADLAMDVDGMDTAMDEMDQIADDIDTETIAYVEFKEGCLAE